MPRTPKDFKGQNVNKDTYRGDWVFVRDKHPKGPNQDNSAWMTLRQRKQLHYENQSIKAARQADQAGQVAAAGATPGAAPAGPTVTVPIPGFPAGRTAPGTPLSGGGPFTQSKQDVYGQRPGQGTTTDTPGIPSWWIAQAIQNPVTEEQKFANVANALLPTLAPEDQRTLATYLAQNYKDVYGGYANTNFGPAPTEITDQVRNQYLSPQRAQLAVSLLDRMKQASGVQDMGAGYDYLKNAVNLINQFTTGGAMTRERYAQFQNAVANLNKTVGADVSAYANLAQLFNMPQFTAGPLVSNTPNSKLFG